ncbi:hypothetical protein XENTR_v10014811 [Xenopus tropicalis]|nr:hypothetical protein XENTR_v10014811 [Xenopus tropicalis]
MTLAARKKGSCNSRGGMLASALLSVLSIIGAVYCTIISLFAVAKGPLVCETGSHELSSCDYTLANLSSNSFKELRFDLAWLLNSTCSPTVDLGITAAQGIIPKKDLSIELNEDTQKIIHITVFVALAIIGLVEALVAISQAAAGLFGFICGTSKRGQSQYA